MEVWYLLIRTDWGLHTADEVEAPNKRIAEGIFRARFPSAMRTPPGESPRWSIVDHHDMVDAYANEGIPMGESACC